MEEPEIKTAIERTVGRFDTPQEAPSAYKEAKLEYVQDLMELYPDQRIKQAVIRKAEALYA